MKALQNAFVAAGAVVTKDVKAFALVKGVPARQVGWISKYGDNIPLPLEGNGSWTCQKMNIKYSLKQSEIFAEKIQQINSTQQSKISIGYYEFG